MKQRQVKKRQRRHFDRRLGRLRRETDRHDRWWVLAFMRKLVETLARSGSVDDKLAKLATAARLMAPAIGAMRRQGEGEEVKR